MARVVTIAGADVSTRVDHRTLEITAPIGGRATCSFKLVEELGEEPYRPALDAEVIVTNGGVRTFGGVILATQEQGLGGAAIVTRVDAAGYSVYAERRYINFAWEAGNTLAQMLGELVYLALGDYGITVHPSQASGPTLEALSYDYRRVSDILDEFAIVAGGWVWSIDYQKRLRMWAPGDVAAPFSITDADPHQLGDITVSPRRTNYANRIILRAGSGGSSPSPFTVIVNDEEEQGPPGNHGIWEAVIEAPDCHDASAAADLADGYLGRRVITRREITLETDEAGLQAGQSLTVSIASRALDGAFLIEEVITRDAGGLDWHQVKALEGNVYAGAWWDLYRQWSGADTSRPGGGGGGSAAGMTRVTYPLAFVGVSFVSSPGPEWVDAPSALDISLDSADWTGATVKAIVQLRARSAGISVQARLRNTTDNSDAGISVVVISTSWVTVEIVITLASGVKSYRLQLLAGAANEDVYGIGYLEMRR